jgi:hypothetical protein
VQSRKGNAQPRAFPAEALFPRKPINAAFPGTKEAGVVKVCHFIIIPVFFALVTRSFFATLFNEKVSILPLYSMKKWHISHFIQRKSVNSSTLFNEKVAKSLSFSYQRAIIKAGVFLG